MAWDILTLKNYPFVGNSNLTKCLTFSFAKPVNSKPESNGVYPSASKAHSLWVQNRMRKCREWI